MNGNLNLWDAELMLNLEMDEIKREMKSIRLLREARVANPGWFERALIAIGSGLVKRGQELREAYMSPLPGYRIESGKLAP